MTQQTFAEVFKPCGHRRPLYIFLKSSPTIQRKGYWHPVADLYVVISPIEEDLRFTPAEVQRWEYVHKGF